MLNITKDNFRSEVIESRVPVIVDWYASWCGSCKVISPLLDSIAEAMPGCKFIKIDADEEHELCNEYGIRNLPTILIFKGGKMAGKIIGAFPIEELRTKIKNIVD